VNELSQAARKKDKRSPCLIYWVKLRHLSHRNRIALIAAPVRRLPWNFQAVAAAVAAVVAAVVVAAAVVGTVSVIAAVSVAAAVVAAAVVGADHTAPTTE
jgi:hypothetical protein